MSFYKYAQLGKFTGTAYRLTTNLPGITASVSIPSNDEKFIKRAMQYGRVIIAAPNVSTVIESKTGRFAEILDAIVNYWVHNATVEFNTYLGNPTILTELDWRGAQCPCDPARKWDMKSLRELEQKEFANEIKYSFLSGSGKLLFRMEINASTDVGKGLIARVDSLAKKNRLDFASGIPSGPKEGSFRVETSSGNNISLKDVGSAVVYQIYGPADIVQEQASWLVNVTLTLARMYSNAAAYRDSLLKKTQALINARTAAATALSPQAQPQTLAITVAESQAAYSAEKKSPAKKKSSRKKASSSPATTSEKPRKRRRRRKHICKSAGRPPKKLPHNGRCRRIPKKRRKKSK